MTTKTEKQQKNYSRLIQLKQVEQDLKASKRLDKYTLSYCIAHVEPFAVEALYPEYLKRVELVEAFNILFGTEIK